MGVADVIPGVSGGTVALLTGIYQQLVLSITRFDRRLAGMVVARRVGEALDYVNWKFLGSLGLGIGAGFIVAIRSLGHYLDQPDVRGYILATFFGMIIAASVIVWRMIPRDSTTAPGTRIMLAGAGILVAAAITFLRPQTIDEMPLWYVFVCGAVGICAMILPGISGALILLLLGMYEPLVATGREILEFKNLSTNIPVAVTFGIGAACGLAGSSRTLRWLLEKYNVATLSMLCGLMLGSLPLLWPWQSLVEDGATDNHKNIFQRYWPDTFDSLAMSYLMVAVVAIGAVMFAEVLAHRHARKNEGVADSHSNED